MSRIYVVSERSGPTSLVRAISKAQAIRFVAEQAIAVRIASQDDIVEAMTLGVTIDDASQADPVEQE